MRTTLILADRKLNQSRATLLADAGVARRLRVPVSARALTRASSGGRRDQGKERVGAVSG